jgi:glyoxylase-like metal-dependent hydrolase (beta-lactamase superfamily II)
MKAAPLSRLASRFLSITLGTWLTAATWAQSPPELTLTRLDCGTSAPPADVGRFSDTFALQGMTLQLVFSCYLIKHGDDYMLWDTGHAMNAPGVAPKTSVIDQLAQLQIRPEQVRYIGISHYHPDHSGQAATLPQATLLIGQGDWDVLNSPKPLPGANPAFFAPWIRGGGKTELVQLDRDVFGDGTVLILATPGHTPGHHSVLVRLKQMGNVLISGDLAHFHENYESQGVPSFNTGRAETLASLDRFKKLAANLKATVIIQHDPRDVGLLPVFPVAAR